MFTFVCLSGVWLLGSYLFALGVNSIGTLLATVFVGVSLVVRLHVDT